MKLLRVKNRPIPAIPEPSIMAENQAVRNQSRRRAGRNLCGARRFDDRAAGARETPAPNFARNWRTAHVRRGPHLCAQLGQALAHVRRAFPLAPVLRGAGPGVRGAMEAAKR
jgi:hypothetical protein